MTFSGWLQPITFTILLIISSMILGPYMYRVFTGQHVLLERVLGPVERLIYRSIGVDPRKEQNWKHYAVSLVAFAVAGWVLMYVILRTQSIHPWNPGGFHAMPWNVAVNTTTSFVTNTNWQYFGGETTLSYFSQMSGLAVQNFVSAATGIVVVIALIRGIVGRSGKGLGNFWQDVVRCTLYILLPISIIGALILVSQGVIQTFSHTMTAHTLTGLSQHIAVGPVASQEVIKNLGTNGGGFFNANAAHPFENPNGFTNMLEPFLQFMIPAALTVTFGKYVGRMRQGWTIFAVMTVMFLAGFAVLYGSEVRGTAAQHSAGVVSARVASGHGLAADAGGNMEGKEQRFGLAGTALFQTVATDTSTGAVDTALDSLTGLGGVVPMANLGTGEVIFGGVGSGLYIMLMYILIAVFIGGLMVGRTPEYLGKKIEAREIKLGTLAILITPLVALTTTAIMAVNKVNAQSIFNAGPQGFSETLYANLSQSNNNGSAFAGYTGFIQPNAPGNVGAHGLTLVNLIGSFDLAFCRFVPIILVLAVGGSLAGKKVSPAGLGTMRTDNITFGVLLIGIIVLVGALSFFPAFMLGPIVNQLTGQLF